jgi:hypothetical protein
VSWRIVELEWEVRELRRANEMGPADLLSRDFTAPAPNR